MSIPIKLLLMLLPSLLLLLLLLLLAAVICTLQKLIRFAASAVALIAYHAARLMKGHRSQRN